MVKPPYNKDILSQTPIRPTRSDRLCMLVASLFGAGYVPLGSGTAASVAALFIFILVKNQIIFLTITIFSTIISFMLSSQAEILFGEKDSKKIVIDDFSGMLITYLFIPHDIRYIITGFFLFRMLDMIKIPPADKIEKFKGAIGVVGDDVVAGLYANIMLQSVIFITQKV